MRKGIWIAGVLLAAVALSAATDGRGADAPDDRVALSGLKRAKAVFDVRAGDAEKLVFNLELIRETFEGLSGQKVKPTFVVAFRGPGVRLLAKDGANAEVASLLAELAGKGIRLEACGVATRLFKVDEGSLLPDVVLVGNALNSLIGYQARGYALVTLN